MKTDVSNRLGAIKDFLHRYILSESSKMWGFIRPAWLQATIKGLGSVLWVIFPFLCFLGIEYINFYDMSSELTWRDNFGQITKLLEKRPSVVVLDLIILYIISVTFVLLFKRLWASCAVLGAISVLVPCVSFLKYQLTGEYFYPWDLQQTGNVGLLADYVSIPLPDAVWVISAVFAAATLLVFFSKASLSLRWNIRIPTAVIVILTIYISCTTPSTAKSIASKHGMAFDNAALQSSNYVANGFIGAFTLNVLSGTIAEPSGYSEELIENYTEEYSSAEASEDFSYPNVILILQESFWDVTRIPDVTFSADPLKNFREIASRDGVYSGNFTTASFGGGTVRPEFEVLTGLTADYLPSGTVPYQYIKSNIESYPSIYKDLGYTTMAIHPYLSNFYMRNTKYPLIGIEETYFSDELTSIEEVTYTWRGNQISDSSVVDYISYFIEDKSEPLFLFAITMEGHQPYTDKFWEEQLEITVQCDEFDEELTRLVEQYVQSVVDADRAILKLTEYIDSCEEDTILVLFGDHAPSLGSNKAAYKYGGLIEDPNSLTKGERSYVFTTPFLIYSNFELGESTMLTEGSDNLIASYNLMNAATELVGGPKTVLMDFLRSFHEAFPGYNYRMGIELTYDEKIFTRIHKALTYDRLVGRLYSIN